MRLLIVLFFASILTTAFCSIPATLLLSTTSEKLLLVKIRNSQCLKCKLIELAQLSDIANVTVSIDTYYPDYYFHVIERETTKELCAQTLSKPIRFGENASYYFHIRTNESEACSITTVIDEKMPLYLPLYIAIGVLVACGFIYVLGKYLYRRFSKMSQSYINSRIVNSDFGIAASSYTNLVEDADAQTQTQAQTQSNRQKTRIKSVDALRGFSLALMVFVNAGSGGYSMLSHAVWDGLHLADLLFPCFVFVMGLAIPLSFRALSSRSIDRVTGQRTLKTTTLVRKIVTRSIMLFFFGLIISNSADQYISHLRIMGVLQRFAVCYLVCTAVEFIYFRMNNFVYVGFSFDQDVASWNSSKIVLIKSKFKEIFLYPIQWLIIMLLILVWMLLTFLLPIEGCPTGYLGPGGLHENGSYFNCTGGASGYIDRLILGPSHLYAYPTSHRVYQSTIPYDPEGLLGCLTSCVLTYLGIVTGHILIHYTETLKRLTRFLLYSILWASIALALCQFKWDDSAWLPINKNLWSLSYVFLMASISLFTFTVFFLLMDVYDVYSGAPFIYLGRNSIVVYLGHEILSNAFPLFKVPDEHVYKLAMNIYWVTLWTIVAAIMDYKKVYINL